GPVVVWGLAGPSLGGVLGPPIFGWCVTAVGGYRGPWIGLSVVMLAGLTLLARSVSARGFRLVSLRYDPDDAVSAMRDREPRGREVLSGMRRTVGRDLPGLPTFQPAGKPILQRVRTPARCGHAHPADHGRDVHRDTAERLHAEASRGQDPQGPVGGRRRAAPGHR